MGLVKQVMYDCWSYWKNNGSDSDWNYIANQLHIDRETAMEYALRMESMMRENSNQGDSYVGQANRTHLP